MTFTKEQIHEAIIKHHKKEFGYIGKPDYVEEISRDGYFITGFVRAALDEMEKELDQTEELIPKTERLLSAVHNGKVLVTWNGNDAGILWERLWKWSEDKGYQSKSVASGDFSGWHSHDNQSSFISDLREHIRKFKFDPEQV